MCSLSVTYIFQELVKHSEEFQLFCRFLSEDVNLEDENRWLLKPFRIHKLKGGNSALHAVLQVYQCLQQISVFQESCSFGYFANSY